MTFYAIPIKMHAKKIKLFRADSIRTKMRLRGMRSGNASIRKVALAVYSPAAVVHQK